MIILLSLSCNKPDEDDCNYQTIKLELEKPYNYWFNYISSNNGYGNSFNLHSSGGLTDVGQYEE